jgi:DNA-binding transcriptional LysR family regulator
MDFDQLNAFDRVAREGSFSRAATALGLGQPAISARIAALENAVGGLLFTRGRRIALTAVGETFLPHARRLLEVMGEGLEAARQAEVGQRGRVTLGTLGSLAAGLVGPALAAFLRDHPQVEVFARATEHEGLIRHLQDGLVDLAIVAWPCTEAASAQLTPLIILHEPVRLVCHPDHPLAARRSVTQADVARLARPFLRLRWWQAPHPAVTRLAARTGNPLEVPMETARHLALQGRAAGFFTHTYVAEDLQRGTLKHTPVRDLPAIYRDSALVRRARGAPLSPAAAALVTSLRRQAGALKLLPPAR